MNRTDAILLARKLRKSQTPQEKIIWDKVRNRQLLGLKFTRQFPISYSKDAQIQRFFIVDFYCHKLKLIIEIDGLYHKKFEGHDREREDILKIYGYNILRFSNEMVENDLENVLMQIENFNSNCLK